MTEPRLTPGGLATQYSSVGHYELADDEALIVTVPAPRTAPYQGFQLGSHVVRLAGLRQPPDLASPPTRRGVDPDGLLRFVVSERDPGLANWLERTGHRPGLPADPVAAPVPRVHRGGRARPSRRSPSTRSPTRCRTTPSAGEPRRVADPDRRPAGRRREQDARLMAILEDKVVVVAGRRPRAGPLDRDPVREGRGRRGARLAHRSRGWTRWPRRSSSSAGARCTVRTDINRRGVRRSTWSTPRSTSTAGWTRWSTTPSRSRRSARCRPSTSSTIAGRLRDQRARARCG